MSCPKGEELSNGLCYPMCPPGYTGLGSLCYQNCPIGFTDATQACLKPQYQRPIARPPLMTSCGSLRDDGSNCWADQNCSFVPTPDRTGMQLRCTGQGIIKITREERMSCPAGHELIHNHCYVNCPAGYKSVGSRCYANCPTGFIDTGSHCIKASKPRPVGGLRQSGLKTITDDPRKSTITKRYQLGSNPNDRYKKQRINNMFGFSSGSDLFTSLRQNAQNFLVANKNDWCSGNQWQDADTWLKFAGLIVIAVIFVYAGPQIGGTIQAFFGSIFGFFGVLEEGAKQGIKVTGEAVQQGVKVTGEAIQGAVKTGSTLVQGAASGLESIQQSNAENILNDQELNALREKIQLYKELQALKSN